MDCMEFRSPGGMGSCGRDLGAEKHLSGGEGMAGGVKETEEELGRGPGKGGPGMHHYVGNRLGLLSLEHRVWSRPVQLTSCVTLASSLASRSVNPIRVSCRIPWGLRW